MSGAGSGNGQQPRSNNVLSNRDLANLIIPTIPAPTTPKPSSRPPKFLENMDRRGPGGMINPAPRPVIRTEENDPMPPLAEAVEAVSRRNARTQRQGIPSSKKRKVGPEEAITPSTKPANTTTSKRGPNLFPKLPEAPAQAEKCDQMLWEMKLAGKGWMEIAEKWEKLTNTTTETKEQDPRETLRKRRLLIEKLAARFVKLKENYAASGTMELPEPYSEAHPADLKYRKISDRKKQDVKLINIMEKTKAQMEDDLWKTFCHNYQQEFGEEISMAEARGRYEDVVNGVPVLKPTAAEERDMLEVKKEIIVDPVAIDDEE
ncbi:hypothetical protein H2200_007105 [Cladophialophora chaetospira]|uniref:Uncharacterized protein n=1 Tax=Cladophialophora chaetospira TaxID=386627 RepID=A0AA38X770_9EURO|nr:hypothetical protein H2200_007105 [Cladophialophora chaetospira]